jgi:hypothetical protein
VIRMVPLQATTLPLKTSADSDNSLNHATNIERCPKASELAVNTRYKIVNSR